MTASIAAPTAAPAPDSAAQLAKIKQTAQQFEAIFLRQIMAAARKTNFGDTSTDSQGLDTFQQMQDSQFADIASKKGTFGLAGLIEKQLIHRAGLNPAAGSGR